MVVAGAAQEGDACSECGGNAKCTMCSGIGVLVGDPHSPEVVASVMLAVVQRMTLAHYLGDDQTLIGTLGWGSDYASRILDDPRAGDMQNAVQRTIDAAEKGDELLARVAAQEEAQPNVGALTAEDLAELGIEA